jgi:tetratricopeptide (TPR) repeat protein
MTAETQLDTLEAKGLIRLATIQPELEYLFRHALVQDAAYGSLLKQERRGLHAQVGQALEELYPERREELAAVLGMHFEQAGENDKALDYLISAGNYAIQRNAIREAFDAFDRAGALLPAEGPDDDAELRRQRIEVRLGRVQSGFSFRPAEEMLAELDDLVPAADALADDQVAVKVHMLSALARLQIGDDPSNPAVALSLGRIREIGQRIGDQSLQALPMALTGMSNVFSGSLRTGVRQLEESVPLLETTHDSIAASFARGALAVGYATLGEFEKATAAARRASEVAEGGDIIAVLDTMIMDAMVRSQMGDLEAAVPLARHCVERSEETGASGCIMASAWVLGDAFHRQGRFEEARAVLQRGADVSQIVDRKVWRPTLQAWLKASSVALGEGEGDFEEALETARSIGNKGGAAGILAKRAEAAVRRGDVDAALPDFEASAGILEAEGARPNLARTLREWGEALRAAGRTTEAESILRRALRLFEELGLDREAMEVRTVLALGDTTITFD